MGLLLIVIGASAIGYRLLSKKLAKSEQETIDINIITQSNKIVLDKLLEDQKEKDRQKQASELAAKFKRDAFIIEARGLTNDLSVTLAKVDPAIASWKEFMEGSVGRPVAKHEDLVKLADFYVKATPMTLSAEQGKSQLEFVRTVLFTVQAMQGEADPGNTYTDTLSSARAWIRKTEMEIETRSGFMSQILTQARSKGEHKTNIPDMSLTLAIEWVKGDIIIKQKETEVLIDTNDKIQKDLLAKKAADEKLRIERENFERERDRVLRELQAKYEKQKLIEEAQSAETRQILRPFLDIGVKDQNRQTMLKPGPVSLSVLDREVGGFGAGHSVAKLISAASDSRFTDRTRWPKSQNDAANIRQAQMALDKLIRLGPTLVELGMLRP